MSIADRLWIIPLACLFYSVFAIAIIASIVAFYLMMLSAGAWKLYAACGGQMPKGLTEAAVRFGVLTRE